MANVVKWFEIPSVDFERAVKFYNKFLNTELEETDVWGYPAALFQNEGEGVTGALVCSDKFKVTQEGTILYFEGNDQINEMLTRVEAAGGTIDTPKTSLGDELGFYALIIDTEGNKIGIYSDY